MATEILLIRHGLTDAVGHVIAGRQAGWSLNETGRQQTAALVAQLATVHLAAVISSPLERTLQTAEAIARTRGLVVERDAAFLEFNFGDWEGRTFAELSAEQAWQRFNRVRSLTRAPGGESMLDVQQRAVRALTRLAARFAAARVAVVSHGDVIRAVLMFALGMPLEFVDRLEIAPARLSILRIDADSATVRQVNGDRVPADT